MESSWDPTLSPLPYQQPPHLICLLFMDAIGVLVGMRDVLWAPGRNGLSGRQENSIYRHLICTSGGSEKQAGLVQDVKLSDMPDCYHCQIQFPLPLCQAHGVHLFMETVWSWLGIFRQSLCWAGVTSHQSSTCQRHPASLLQLFVVKF